MLYNSTQTIKDITIALITRFEKEDKNLTTCNKREFTLAGTEYVMYEHFGICSYCEKGSMAMMNEAAFIASLSSQQIYALIQLGLDPQPPEKVQDFLDKADRL